MSTKALRTIAGMMGCTGTPEKCLHCGATRELEAIERAAKGLCHRGETFGSIHEKHWAVFESIARDAP